LLLFAGCDREHVDERLITSYSIETQTEAERNLVAKEFQSFLDTLGMEKALAAGAHPEGFHKDGEITVRCNSKTAPYSITIVKNPHPKYLSGDIAWDFRGPKKDWLKFESELRGFQTQVVEWYKKRPDVLQKESTYWDCSM